MNIPNSMERGDLPNLHPTQYGSSDMVPGSLPESMSDRVGSWVGSCSRTSLMYMAENVSGCRTVEDAAADHRSLASTDTLSVYEYHPPNAIGAPPAHERSSLLGYTPVDKVSTGQSSVCLLDPKKSSFTQSVFNSINILAGVGILALPLGFKYTGWIIGIILFTFCLGITNYSAKLLGQCLRMFPDCVTYGDIGHLAFNGKIPISFLFVIELITATVALVVLLADGLEVMLPPGTDALWIKLLCFVILTPMLFLPVRHLAYTSLIGILSAVCVLVVLLIDGFSKRDAPGSLWQAADTEIWPSDPWLIAKSFGLVMGGFAGHAVFPTIYRDMARPSRYPAMVDLTYITTAILYFGVAAGGYRMFGSTTMAEITQNLVSVPSYNRALNHGLLVLIALNPISKYGLTLNPVITTVENSLIPWLTRVINGADTDAAYLIEPKHHAQHRVLQWLTRIVLSAIVVGLAYMIPDFDRVMSLLGAFFSFLISGIFPILCYLRLFHGSLTLSHTMLLYALLFACISMAIIGTASCFV
ncbi:transmembrane amino acid transporter protein-domain-containing protein [Gongronella butleri]|nr:transmembrane amino acid transporter protein-domain-containing protein [Gongronella butleri]